MYKVGSRLAGEKESHEPNGRGTIRGKRGGDAEFAFKGVRKEHPLRNMGRLFPSCPTNGGLEKGEPRVRHEKVA